MMNAGFYGAAALPVVVLQSPQQASLAAGAEAFIQISFPLNLLSPSAGGAFTLPVLFSVSATDTPSAGLVVTGNVNNATGSSVIQCRVRNVGTVASGAFQVTALVLGAGQAIGL